MSQNLDPRLLNYKKNAQPLYLDGRYFNIVLGKSNEVSTKPIVIKIKPSGVEHNLGTIYMDVTRPYMLFRIIIEIYESVKVRGRMKDKLYTRHSNLLIFDNMESNIMRFEPLQKNDYTGNIDNVLMDYFSYTLPQHNYAVFDLHPQPHNNIGLCVAYVIKFAYYYVMREQIVFEGESDIIRFSLYINELYSKQLTGAKDIEFGNYNPVLGGAAVGGLTGGLVGGLAGGPAGAAVGLGVGALGGATIGALSPGSPRRRARRRRY